MIIKYNGNEFGNFKILGDEYLLGVFVLNDEMKINNESLGQYIRSTEKANHKEWIDGSFKEFPYSSLVKPFSKICSTIKTLLSKQFSKNIVVSIDGASSIYQKRLGKQLMPPEDFGDKPSPVKRATHPKAGIPGINKIKPVAFISNGFKGDCLSYSFEVMLSCKQIFETQLNVKTANKIYSFNEWEDFGFEVPCIFSEFDMPEYFVNNKMFPFAFKKEVNDDFLKKIAKRDSQKNNIFLITGIKSNKENISGFKISNETNGDIKFRINLLVKPIDLSYSIVFDYSIKSGGIGNE